MGAIRRRRSRLRGRCDDRQGRRRVLRVSTLVCFHAHPDDEAISTGGLMAKAAAAGHRVVLVVGTRGEQGEPQAGVLNEGEALWERRVAETAASCAALGVDEPRFLGYEDSGMMGEPTNDNPSCFWQADEAEATARLAAILTEVEADTLTIYDDHGGYGHPDHIRVHQIGLAAGRAAGVEHIFEATMNRTRIIEAIRSQEVPVQEGGDSPPTEEEMQSFGTPAADISFAVNVVGVIDQKRASMMAHRSQIGPDSFFLNTEPEQFAAMFGEEFFNVPGVSATGGPLEVDLLPGLVSERAEV